MQNKNNYLLIIGLNKKKMFLLLKVYQQEVLCILDDYDKYTLIYNKKYQSVIISFIMDSLIPGNVSKL